MKQGTGVKKWIEETIEVCDVCKTPLEADKNWITYNFRHSDGWDSYGDVIDVCSMECLHKKLSLHLDYHFPAGYEVSLSVPSEIMKELLNK